MDAVPREVEHYTPVIFACCLKMLRDREGASDASQEVALRLVRDLPQLESHQHVLRWIRQVATNYCLNVVRTTWSRKTKEELLREPGERLIESTDAERNVVGKVLARFDEDTRAIAMGVLVAGMTHDEAAAALGLSSRTIIRRLDRFLREAREFLQET